MAFADHCVLPFVLVLVFAAQTNAKACDNFDASKVPTYRFLEPGATAESFVKEVFTNYATDIVYSNQCTTKFAMMVIEQPPFDPSGQTPNPGYNTYVSTQMMGLPRAVEVGDKLFGVHVLAGGWNNNATTPDVFANTKNDLTANDPGQAPGVPDGSVTCMNSTYHAEVSGMQCAYCDIASTCLAGMGCFKYFAAECFYETGSAADAAGKMVSALPWTCGSIKKQYQAKQCCGKPGVSFDSRMTCGGIKSKYKFQQCCGNPDKGWSM